MILTNFTLKFYFTFQEITLPSTENKIKLVVEKGCVRLPSSISDQCRAFIDTYMDEFVALLAQEIDPSQVWSTHILTWALTHTHIYTHMCVCVRDNLGSGQYYLLVIISSQETFRYKQTGGGGELVCDQLCCALWIN